MTHTHYNHFMKLLMAGLLLSGISFTSCKSWNKSQKGAVIGTAGGAAAGAVIGKAAGNVALGAIIGAAVGGASGAIIGHEMDKQAEEMKNEIPGAVVERVEEGIVIEFNSEILFGFDQSGLTADSRNSLNNLVAILQKYPDTNIETQGHTDSKGSISYNQALSERRATTVSEYLVESGMASMRLTTKGFGETAPKYDNSTSASQARNRRVEFLVTANEKMKADAAKEAEKAKSD